MKKLTEIQKAHVAHKLREAVFHLSSCWDALREAEEVTRTDIATELIEPIAGDVQEPSEAFALDSDDLFVIFENTKPANPRKSGRAKRAGRR